MKKPIYKVIKVEPYNGRMRKVHYRILSKNCIINKIYIDEDYPDKGYVFFFDCTDGYWIHTSLVQSVDGDMGDNIIIINTLNTKYTLEKQDDSITDDWIKDT